MNVFSGILILSIGIIPAFLSLKTTGNVKLLLIILTLFTMIHGSYHFLDSIGFEFLSDFIIRPISVIVLIIFGIITLRIKRKKSTKRSEMKH